MEEGQSKPEDSDPSSNASEPRHQQLDAIIQEVKLEFREWKLVKRRDLITKLGNAYENVVSDLKDVCEEIKNVLRDEIAEGLISARDIERYCPRKWKNSTKPTACAKTENDNLSFSKQVEGMAQQQIAGAQDGNSVIINESSDGINHPEGEANQNRLDDDNEEGILDADSKEDSIVTPSLNGEIASTSKQSEATRYVSHIPVPFERLRKDMYAVAQRTNGMGNVFWELSVDLATRLAKIEFCGITQHKDAAMISIGKGELKEAS